MIYVDNLLASQVLYLPRNGYSLGEEDTVALRVRSTETLKETSFTVEDAEVRGSFLRLTVALPEGELTPGEWKYELAIGETVVGTGLLVASEGSEDAAQYEREITYKQYGE